MLTPSQRFIPLPLRSQWRWHYSPCIVPLAILFLITFINLGYASPAWAGLPQGNAITDPKALLRYALPIDNPTVRKLQGNLEDISVQLRGKRWSAIKQDLKQATDLCVKDESKVLASIAPNQQTQARQQLSALQTAISAIGQAVETKNKEVVRATRLQALDIVGELEEMMVEKQPFSVPAIYANLPQLHGRATVEITTSKGVMTAVVDGYNAPVTAGNFIDLVQRGFYNGLPFTRAEESYVLQAGDPPGPEVGFVDPQTQQYRSIPMEIFVKGDDTPIYNQTFEELGRYLDKPILPFSAFGTLGMARPADEPGGGSSQFFFFLFEPELTPAGLNLLDGRYAVFGYVTEHREVLDQIRQGDTIETIKVLSGLENLVIPKT